MDWQPDDEVEEDVAVPAGRRKGERRRRGYGCTSPIALDVFRLRLPDAWTYPRLNGVPNKPARAQSADPTKHHYPPCCFVPSRDLHWRALVAAGGARGGGGRRTSAAAACPLKVYTSLSSLTPESSLES